MSDRQYDTHYLIYLRDVDRPHVWQYGTVHALAWPTIRQALDFAGGEYVAVQGCASMWHVAINCCLPPANEPGRVWLRPAERRHSAGLWIMAMFEARPTARVEVSEFIASFPKLFDDAEALARLNAANDRDDALRAAVGTDGRM